MRVRGLTLALLLASGCGVSATRVVPIGVTLDGPVPHASAKVPPPPDAVPADIVARAAQPYHARRNSDGRDLARTELLDELSHFDVLCLGEAHDAARDHFAELSLVEGLTQRARVSGRALGVGFEMFQFPYGDALRAYARGRIDDATLRRRTHYDERWGFPYAYYQPVLAYGRAVGISLKALNATRELTHAVAQGGLDALTVHQRRQLPELDLDDSTHRARFDEAMSGHPKGPGMNLDNFYVAQVIWDETMADNATRWVSARAPSRQLVVLAGSAHCRHEAIPARVERRAALNVANVRLSEHSADDSEGFGYTLIFDQEVPPRPNSSNDG
jgi:uncharacterized iron-regulated protein